MTDKRIVGCWRALLKEIDGVYQLRKQVKSDFWPTWDREEPILIEKLKERPIALLHIENLFSAFRAKMLKAL